MKRSAQNLPIMRHSKSLGEGRKRMLMPQDKGSVQLICFKKKNPITSHPEL